MPVNPLLNKYHHLPPFAEILPEHVYPAMVTTISEYQRDISNIVDQESDHTWNSLFEPMFDADHKLNSVIGPITHLCSVNYSDELQSEYDRALPLLTDLFNWVNQHDGLYDAILSIHARNTAGLLPKKLNSQQLRTVTNYIESYQLSGIDLPEEDKVRLASIQTQLSTAQNEFSTMCIKATDGKGIHVTDEARLVGMPKDAIAAALDEADHRNLSGWVFTLHGPSVSAVLAHADDRTLREEMYLAYNTKGSEFDSDGIDTSDMITQILKLKTEKAIILGFDSYSHLSTHKKMSKTPQTVFKFLDDLKELTLPIADQEFSELVEFAEARGLDEVTPWDIPYYAEKMRETYYSYSDSTLREYFSADKVLSTMFHITTELFGVTFQQRQTRTSADGPIHGRQWSAHIQTWHSDVQFYDVINSDGDIIAGFYLDLYSRTGKRGGAWMDECIPRRKRKTGHIQLPVAYLNCNFSNSSPALLSMGDIETLFHEFGHGLHHMLTTIDVPAIAGISGVQWDAVEVPSQFMEHFCWDKGMLRQMSSHCDTGEEVPEWLLTKVIQSKNFRSASGMLRQLEFSIFDMMLYHEYPHKPEKVSDNAYIKTTFTSTMHRTQHPKNRMFNTFAHIWGGYSAGYYSYKWAEVISSDVFESFERHGNILSRKIGLEFLSTILSRGGSKDFSELFISFKQQELSLEPLLRHNGISIK